MAQTITKQMKIQLCLQQLINQTAALHHLNTAYLSLTAAYLKKKKRFIEIIFATKTIWLSSRTFPILATDFFFNFIFIDK